MSLLRQGIQETEQDTFKSIAEESIASIPVLQPKESLLIETAFEKEQPQPPSQVNLQPMDNIVYQERLFILRKENLKPKEYQQAKKRLRMELDPRFKGILNLYI